MIPFIVNDAHCHFFSTQFLATLAAGLGPLKHLPQDQAADAITNQLGWDSPGTPEVLADRWVSELDRHAVGRAVLIASVPGDEASVAAAIARHPTRLVGFFMLDPTQDDAPARVDRALSNGLRGICLFPAMHRFRMDDDRVLAIFDRAAAHPGTAVFVHCGVLSVGIRKKLGLASRFDIRLGNPLAVHVAASAFPNVPVVIPHFGGGFFREALMAADLSPNIHFDTSSSNSWIKYHPGLTLSGVFRSALDCVGPERLLFGTDSSFFPRGWQRVVFDAQMTALDAAGVPGIAGTAGTDVSARTQIFAGNFDRLFPAAGAS